jgi:hypothetical protein
VLDQLERLPDPQRLALEVVFGLTAGAAPDPFLVGLATLSLLSEVSEERPLLRVVDDAQWLDQGSAMTVAFVARGLLAAHVGLVSQSANQTMCSGTCPVEPRARALVADPADAEALYRRAIKRLGRTRFRAELARARLVYGEWLRREHRRVDARAQLRAAHDLLTSIGMESFAERARRELLATGETRGSARSRRSRC